MLPLLRKRKRVAFLVLGWDCLLAKHAKHTPVPGYGKHGKGPTEFELAIRRLPAVILAIELVLVAVFAVTCTVESRLHGFDNELTAFAAAEDRDSGDLIPFSKVVEDGAYISERGARALAGDHCGYADNIEELFQNGVLDGGCEIVSLGIVLNSMGYDVDPKRIADSYLDISGDFSTGYVGNPYWSGGGFPPGIVDAANAYLADQDSGFRAHDLTGTSFEYIEAVVATGRPVMIWSTIGLGEPLFTGITEGAVEWYDNEHCVVLYEVSDGTAYVSDPIEGFVEYDRDKFADIYEACGLMALAIY